MSATTSLPQAEAAVNDLRVAHRELLRVVDSLSDADWERYVPYGDWTVKDLVAHCIGDLSPSGPGLILAGVLTSEFIAETSKTLDVRARNQAMVEERSRLTREDLRQLLFEAHDARISATLRLNDSHLPILQYSVPMGPDYDLRVEDWLWYGYHDRQHADDIRRAVDVDYQPQNLDFLPEIRDRFRTAHRYREGFLRAAYSVADDAWDEPSRDCEGWTYRDILAHVASNDLRVHVRLRAHLGERDEAELAALKDMDGWNRRRVEERRGRSVPELVDELAANRYETLTLLSRLKPEHLEQPIVFSDGSQHTMFDYIEMFTRHSAIHGGHLVPASRARRFAA